MIVRDWAYVAVFAIVGASTRVGAPADQSPAVTLEVQVRVVAVLLGDLRDLVKKPHGGHEVLR